MNPFRWDVLLVGFLLALPVFALGLRGDLSVEEMTARLPWCLAAGWGVVALLRFAGTPRTTNGSGAVAPRGAAHPFPAETSEPLTTESERVTEH
jgi:hypothetical protein